MVRSISNVSVIKMEIQVQSNWGFYLQKADFKKTECKFREIFGVIIR